MFMDTVTFLHTTSLSLALLLSVFDSQMQRKVIKNLYALAPYTCPFFISESLKPNLSVKVIFKYMLLILIFFHFFIIGILKNNIVNIYKIFCPYGI